MKIEQKENESDIIKKIRIINQKLSNSIENYLF